MLDSKIIIKKVINVLRKLFLTIFFFSPQTGKSSSGGSSVEDTKFNTERNTGRARSRILQSLIVGHGMCSNSNSSAYNGATLDAGGSLPKPVLRGFGSGVNSEDNFTPSPIEAEEKFKWSLSSSLGANTSNMSNDGDLVCRRALSAMKRSQKVSSYLEEDIFFDNLQENSNKENYPFPWNRKKSSGDALSTRALTGGGGGRTYQLNSTALGHANDINIGGGVRPLLSSSLSSSLKRPFDFGSSGSEVIDRKLSSTEASSVSVSSRNTTDDGDNVFSIGGGSSKGGGVDIKGGEEEDVAMTTRTDSGVSGMLLD